ncbi:MAG: nuclear transport factor 2 family protein [Alphaproteobacteria bacterium]
MNESTLEASAREALGILHEAMAKVANGDVSAIKALYSHAAEATSFYGWGGYEKGWDAVSKRWDWAAQQFQGGSVSHETISQVLTPDMFYVTQIETFSRQRVAGVAGETGWSNRVTHVFARENGDWRLIHRHANRLETQFEPAQKLKAT